MSEMGAFSRWWLRLLAVFAVIFGVVAIKAGGWVVALLADNFHRIRQDAPGAFATYRSGVGGLR